MVGLGVGVAVVGAAVVGEDVGGSGGMGEKRQPRPSLNSVDADSTRKRADGFFEFLTSQTEGFVAKVLAVLTSAVVLPFASKKAQLSVHSETSIGKLISKRPAPLFDEQATLKPAVSLATKL